MQNAMNSTSLYTNYPFKRTAKILQIHPVLVDRNSRNWEEWHVRYSLSSSSTHSCINNNGSLKQCCCCIDFCVWTPGVQFQIVPCDILPNVTSKLCVIFWHKFTIKALTCSWWFCIPQMSKLMDLYKQFPSPTIVFTSSGFPRSNLLCLSGKSNGFGKPNLWARELFSSFLPCFLQVMYTNQKQNRSLSPKRKPTSWKR